MYLFTFVLLSLFSNTQGTFGKINENYGQLWEGWHKRDVESKLAGLVGRGSICPLKTQGQKICRDWGFLSLSVCQTLWAEPGWCSEAGEKVYAFWGEERGMGYGGGDWKGGRASMAQLGAGWKFGKLS